MSHHTAAPCFLVLPLSFYRQTDIFAITLEQTEQTMSLKKNQIFETTIENLSSDGSGVAHVEGQAVFVPGAAPGDVIRCRIVKALKSYAFGRIDAILAPGPGRVAPDCAVCTPCGGCGLRHLSYATECEAKTGFVRDAFARLGGFDVSSFEFARWAGCRWPCRDRFLCRAHPPYRPLPRLQIAAGVDERPGPPGLCVTGSQRHCPL